MKKWLMAVLLGTVLVLGACGGGDTADDNTGVDEGTETEEATDNGADEGEETADSSAAEDAYQQSCASCHGDDLSGGVGPDLSAVGASMSADEIEEVIENGVGSMPAGLLSGDDATAVAEWLAEKE